HLSARPRARHPFPTRRSSDLSLAAASAPLRKACADTMILHGEGLFASRLAECGRGAIPQGVLVAERMSVQNSSMIHFRFVKFPRSEEHTSELQSRENLVCRLL